MRAFVNVRGPAAGADSCLHETWTHLLQTCSHSAAKLPSQLTKLAAQDGPPHSLFRSSVLIIMLPCCRWPVCEVLTGAKLLLRPGDESLLVHPACIARGTAEQHHAEPQLLHEICQSSLAWDMTKPERLAKVPSLCRASSYSALPSPCELLGPPSDVPCSGLLRKLLLVCFGSFMRSNVSTLS